ncbi:MAG: phosphatidate cytidylyltransferase [Lachnospiraceae bacterium]|nr:phosphatidate cytidylyltransferase [Lachnospiraceae bacterium]
MGKDINNDNTFWIRFRSSVILMVITIAAMVLGGYVLWGVSLIVTMIGLMELYRAASVHKTPAAFCGYLAGAAWYVLLLLGYIFRQSPEFKSVLYGQTDLSALDTSLISGPAGIFDDERGLAILIAVFLAVLLAVYVFSFPKYHSDQITLVFFGLFYVAFTLSCIFRLRSMPGGAYTVWLIFVGSWGADTSAYMVGRKLGKTKIVPVLSPKKSLEGFIGGVIGAVLIGVIYALIFKEQLLDSFTNPVLAFGIVGGVASLISMVGDLAASAIKRDKGIKDYGKLIPGHGGILDRFDSVIFVAPVVYYLVAFMSER